MLEIDQAVGICLPVSPAEGADAPLGPLCRTVGTFVGTPKKLTQDYPAISL